VNISQDWQCVCQSTAGMDDACYTLLLFGSVSSKLRNQNYALRHIVHMFVKIIETPKEPSLTFVKL